MDAHNQTKNASFKDVIWKIWICSLSSPLGMKYLSNRERWFVSTRLAAAHRFSASRKQLWSTRWRFILSEKLHYQTLRGSNSDRAENVQETSRAATTSTATSTTISTHTNDSFWLNTCVCSTHINTNVTIKCIHQLRWRSDWRALRTLTWCVFQKSLLNYECITVIVYWLFHTALVSRFKA